jgi:competence protein ComEA
LDLAVTGTDEDEFGTDQFGTNQFGTDQFGTDQIGTDQIGTDDRPRAESSRPAGGGDETARHRGGPGGGLRWEPSRRVLAAIGIAVLVAALVTGWWVLSSRPRQLAVRSSSMEAAAIGTAHSGGVRVAASAMPAHGSAQASAQVSAQPAQSPSAVVVDVEGKVRHPGVYHLSAGARVVDAVRAAGGVRHGASSNAVNLAAPVRDGEQVRIGVHGAGVRGAGTQAGTSGGSRGGSGGGAVPGTAGSTAPVELNSATLPQLETLPGVGPVLAQRILDWRSQHGHFTSVDQLTQVSGIGPATFADLRDAVTV